MIKVGDKVRWIKPGKYPPPGRRGTVLKEDGPDHLQVDWEDGVATTSRKDFVMKEFEVGDRVVFEANDSECVALGTLGTVVRYDGPEFVVDWDNGFSDDHYGYDAECKSMISHVQPGKIYIRAPEDQVVPDVPASPTITVNYQAPTRGKCYFCGCPDSSYRTDRHACDPCSRRYH